MNQDYLEKQRELELLQRVASAANEGGSWADVLRFALSEVCAYTGWPVGHVYLPSADPGGDLIPSSIWHLDPPERFETFRRVTEATRLAPGIGLPGRVYSSASPAWIRDVNMDPNFPRAKAAADIGVKSGFAFPVLVGSEVAAVLEFFSPEIVEPGPQFLQDIAHIGTQLGRAAERSRAEQALRESEERFRMVFERGPIGMSLVDANLRLVTVNDALCRMVGYSREELSRRTFLDITHPEDVAKDEDAARKLFAGEIQSYQTEKRYVTKGGDIVWGFLTASLLGGDGEKPRLGLGIVQDITERKRLEQQLQQSQKMEAVGRLAGGVAHDFNNVLTAISGHAELALMTVEETHPLRSCIEEIQNAAGRASALIAQLLAFSRRQMLQPRVVDLNAVVVGMDAMLRQLIGEDIDLVTVLEPTLGRVNADPTQVEQVLLNLVVNARDAMPAGGRLSIETSNRALGERETGPLNIAPGRYVMITVGDTGCGMDAQTQSRIFEPFFTTKKLGKGTGLGLSTVYGIIKQSGGGIRVHSELGRGSTFQCFLPLVEVDQAPAEGDAPRVRAKRGAETILLTEDETMVRSVARAMLERSGYTVLEASCGEQALEVARSHPLPIDLLVTDVVMPGMSGSQLAVRMTEMRPEVRVLYTSGYTDDAIGHRGVLDAGMFFLQKPFTGDSLARKVREVLDAEPVGR